MIGIDMWVTKASKNTKDTIIRCRTKKSGKGDLIINGTRR